MSPLIYTMSLTTDKRDPTVNAGGLVYGVDGGHGSLLELDTETHEWREIVIEVFDNPDNPAVTRFAQQFPVPSVFYGDEPLGSDLPIHTIQCSMNWVVYG
ncbi:MAG: hypothetical protein CM1200mP40_09830 [Gammaproteobacteria bacterium]|nr:MAG: hypothetical protein CM1200mP40_09830 [Gammaproteobacteria bacterium]